MRLPRPRGPLSTALVEALRSGRTDALEPAGAEEVRPQVWGDDVQLALWTAYELHYRGFEDAAATTSSGGDPEWDPSVLAWRAPLERAFEDAVREAVAPLLAEAREAGAAGGVEAGIAALVAADDGPPLSRHLQRRADREQVVDFLRERSLYHLKESDPSAFVLGRVDGRAKVALAELLYDEYGSGRPHRLHSLLYAEALAAAGLDAAYGAHLDTTSAATLASNNVMSLLALHHRLRGAALGHLAAFEATSTDPCRRIAAGVERVGLGEAVADYFHEHVEADAVHEQVVLGDICGALVEAEPALLDDVLLGAAACLELDGRANRALMERWGVLEREGAGDEAARPRPAVVPAQRTAPADDEERVA